MDQEWISLNEFMRRKHIGYETAIKLINSEKVEYQKLDGKYKIKTTSNTGKTANTESLNLRSACLNMRLL